MKSARESRDNLCATKLLADAGPSPPAFALRAESVYWQARHRRRKAAPIDFAAYFSQVVHSCVCMRPWGFWQVDTSWKVLVVDSVSVRIISAACSMSEVLSNAHTKVAHACTRARTRARTLMATSACARPVVRHAQITDEGVSLVENLELDREPMAAMEAIYFVSPTYESMKVPILKSLSNTGCLLHTL